MKTTAFLGAAGGGLVGAVLWAVIACTTGLEIGYVAWAVGGLVGLGAYALGGRGKAAGVTCAGIAAAAIVAGKVVTIQHFVGGFSVEAVYEELLPKAEAFERVRSEKDYPAFMVAHEYTAATTPEAVRPEEVAAFKAFGAPVLDDMARTKPTFEEWKERPVVKSTYGELKAGASTADVLWASLGFADLIFFFLGVGTAYRICMRDEQA